MVLPHPSSSRAKEFRSAHCQRDMRWIGTLRLADSSSLSSAVALKLKLEMAISNAPARDALF